MAGQKILKELLKGTIKKRKPLGASKKARKVIGKEAADLQTPAAVAKPGTDEILRSGGPKPNVGGISKGKQAAKKANEYDKELAKKEKSLEVYEEKVKNLSSVEKLKFINENKTRIQSLRDSIKDMKKRSGPRVSRKEGGKVMYKKRMSSGGMPSPGESIKSGNRIAEQEAGELKLIPKEKKKSLGKLPKPVRNKMGYKKSGGYVKRAKGGKIGRGCGAALRGGGIVTKY
ncbi:MAG: hypothetical protein VW518_01260 [Burkholderiaceae bacterium]